MENGDIWFSTLDLIILVNNNLYLIIITEILWNHPVFEFPYLCTENNSNNHLLRFGWLLNEVILGKFYNSTEHIKESVFDI